MRISANRYGLDIFPSDEIAKSSTTPVAVLSPVDKTYQNVFDAKLYHKFKYKAKKILLLKWIPNLLLQIGDRIKVCVRQGKNKSD